MHARTHVHKSTHTQRNEKKTPNSIYLKLSRDSDTALCFDNVEPTLLYCVNLVLFSVATL